ncbi:DUF58 domain-containing protein [Haloarcula sp. S1CR25-12]|uniref:DUF58 domain-containing protein n=1 Tax=Haloarcula saliterrae TaxID=2950534 RepID=A0ABU2FEP7_9EURY|nr:DUF58 domain-containing protein [Haloarcula sp. S1CR25-12]MDS0260729.1 DUF58 domain-containing protein [Haloarcula sp. S1CR25-12]
MTDRRLVALGLLAGLGGFLVVAVPALGAALVPTAAAVVLTIGVGVVAVWLAVRQLADADEPFALPTPESRPGYRAVGGELADLFAEMGLAGRRQVESEELTARERLRATLRELAVDVLGRTDGWDAETARERLADGTWTDDEAAAAFFAEGYAPPVSRLAYLPVGRPDLPFARRGRRVVAALADRVGGPVPDTEAAERPTVPTDSYWPTGEFPRERSTGLTAAVVAGALAISAVGVVFGRPGVVLTAALGIALVGAARAWSPEPTVALDRSLSTATGDEVTVTVTVRNTGERTLPDIRLVDGVPAGLSVVEGSPRVTTALRPGKATTASYTVEAVAGRHTFEPGVVVVSDPIGAAETVATVEAADGPTVLDCGFGRPATGSEPPRRQQTVQPGRRLGDASGAGVEFDTLREYRPGDPPARIDWTHRAKTGELATVEFREPRLSKVAVLVDARPAAYVAAPGGVPAPRHAARAAFTVAGGLLAEGVPVGVGTIPVGGHWTPVGAGPDQRARLREALAGDDAVPWLPPDSSPSVAETVAALTARLDPDVQVLFVSPVADEDSVTLARTLDAAGHSVTVVSPDSTTPESVSGAYGRLRRSQRLSALRGAGIPVTDWDPGEGIVGVSHRVRA